VFWPNFIESQLVASIKERKTRYKELYPPTQPPKPFPIELSKNETERIKKINWVYNEDYDYYSESYYKNRLPSLRNIGYENYESEMKSYRKLLETGQYKIIIDEDGMSDKLFYVKRSDVWVGQLD